MATESMPAARVMVVEDQVIVGKELRLTLENAGYKVTKLITRGEEAIRIAAAFRPDLVLMDIGLRGEMDGIETAREIQSRWGVPVIFITAYADDKLLEVADMPMPSGCLAKPFKEKELLAAVAKALGRNRI
jgi:CheY-like chemotaxis protein